MTSPDSRTEGRPADYGIDAPGVIRNFFVLGAALVALGSWIRNPWVGSSLIWWGVAWIACSLFMVLYAKRGKFRHRDRMLGMISWTGQETVLDVGTGRGQLMIGAAKRLTSGRSIGIDIWNAEDLSDNRVENTLKNVRAEGVEGRTEIRSEDVRKMSFAAESFDVILSNLCVHNLYRPEERETACREIARVLKPGGVALISDFRHTDQYAKSFEAVGLKTVILGPFWKDTFPKLTIVRAEKPRAGG
jgi:cyclopropane fatty-acyl-phospholipid synthase-like methyltransferase